MNADMAAACHGKKAIPLEIFGAKFIGRGPVGRDAPVVAIHEVDVVTGGRHHVPNKLCRDPVVGVQEAYPFGVGQLESQVARTTDPAIFLAAKGEPIVMLGKLCDDLAGIVGRSVVNHDGLPVGLRLRLQGRNGFSQSHGRVVGGYDECEGGWFQTHGVFSEVRGVRR